MPSSLSSTSSSIRRDSTAEACINVRARSASTKHQQAAEIRSTDLHSRGGQCTTIPLGGLITGGASTSCISLAGLPNINHRWRANQTKPDNADNADNAADVVDVVDVVGKKGNGVAEIRNPTKSAVGGFYFLLRMAFALPTTRHLHTPNRLSLSLNCILQHIPHNTHHIPHSTHQLFVLRVRLVL
jgi:hypothetical protein